ncbi:MAG: hypothetical protein Q4C44_04135 [bacterium]|nr:hypothetical protein [bacterium]
MICDLYNGYYTYKVKTISQYALILSKILGTERNKLFGNIRNRDDFWNYTVKDYLKRYTDGVSVNKYLVKGFITNKEINSFDLYNETMSVINYFINKNILLKIGEYTNEIVLASIILKIANTLDISTSPFVKNSNNYNTICLNEINSANKISFIHLIDDGKKQTSRLIELMKENVKKERKFFEFLTNLGSFNKYIDISKENIYYFAQYNYRIPSLNKFDEYAAKDVYDKLKIDDSFVLISANLVVASLLKLFSIRKKFKILFLPVRSGFCLDEKNLKELSLIFKNNRLNKYFKLLINYNECDTKLVKLLDKYHLSYYVYCSKNSATDGKLIDGVNNYLVSKEFSEGYKNILTKWNSQNINIIKESFDGIVTDRNLLED